MISMRKVRIIFCCLFVLNEHYLVFVLISLFLIGVGQFCYAGTNFLRVLTSHQTKWDRNDYYDLNSCGDEYGRDAVIHILHNRDVDNALWDTFNENMEYQDQLIRMAMPVPIHASFHVVHGPKEKPLSQARFIKYFDEYRPMKKPEVWWFVSA